MDKEYTFRFFITVKASGSRRDAKQDVFNILSKATKRIDAIRAVESK